MHSHSSILGSLALLSLLTKTSWGDWTDEGQCEIVTDTYTGQWTWIPQESAQSDSTSGHGHKGHPSINSTLPGKPHMASSTEGSITATSKSGHGGHGWSHTAGYISSTPGSRSEVEINTSLHSSWGERTTADPASTEETWVDWSSTSGAVGSRTPSWADWSGSVKSSPTTSKLSTSKTHRTSYSAPHTSTTKSHSSPSSSESETWTSRSVQGSVSYWSRSTTASSKSSSSSSHSSTIRSYVWPSSSSSLTTTGLSSSSSSSISSSTSSSTSPSIKSTTTNSATPSTTSSTVSSTTSSIPTTTSTTTSSTTTSTLTVRWLAPLLVIQISMLTWTRLRARRHLLLPSPPLVPLALVAPESVAFAAWSRHAQTASLTAISASWIPNAAISTPSAPTATHRAMAHANHPHRHRLRPPAPVLPA
jgi:cytochrome c-type biogenesis protein CcmH/NrfF